MKTKIGQSHFQAYPGRETRVEVEITNTDDIIDGVTAVVDGIHPDWVHLERPLVSLFPNDSATLALLFDIPIDCPAGDYLVVANIVSTVDATSLSSHDFWLTVGEVTGVTLEVRPSVITGGKHGELIAIVTNTGNAPADISIDAIEPTRSTDIEIDPTRFRVEPKQPVELPVSLRGPRPWIGQPVTVQVHLSARVDDQIAERIVLFRRKPRIPRGVMTALMLAGIVALWAAMFLWVITQVRSSGPAAKAVATDVMTGPANIPLAAVAGNVEGTITASTTGGPVARATVAASRVSADGEIEPIASAATDDQGGYILPSLLPGDYRIEVSAQGYEPIVLRDDGNDGGEQVHVAPTATVTGLNGVLVGGLGSISGKIAIPPGSEGTPLEVTATMVLEGGADGEAAPTFTQTTTDGTINLTGLPTPATYVVSVTGDGFKTMQFEQTVGGGDASIINTVSVAAGSGTIDGTVTDGNGQPLGGVNVTARSGTTELRSVTPTTGSVGTFRFVDLVTPQTYVLTFELDGYSSATRALELPAGGSRAVSATLIGGKGTAAGQTVDAANNPIGGLVVRIAGGDYAGETATLTTGGTDGPAGSFRFTDLPVPGEYTITVDGDGYLPETVAASFDTAGEVALGSIVMSPDSSDVQGTISGAGGGLGEVLVVITDGERSQVTISASNPAGFYSFANLTPGSYTISFTRDGYRTRHLLVELQAGVSAVADTALSEVGG